MKVSARDLEKVSKLTARTMAVARVLVPLIQPFMRIGFIRRRFARSFSGRIGTMSRLSQRGKHEEAAALAVKALKEYWNQPPSNQGTPNGRDYWWFLMHMAAYNLEQCGDDEKLDGLIEWANAETERDGDNQAAVSYLIFSRSKRRRRDFDAAIRYAQIASEIDETWAEPDYHLGWYALVLGKGDAPKHLIRAVQKDPRILSSIEEDPVCKQHPHIIQKLKRVVAEGTTMSDQEPNL